MVAVGKTRASGQTGASTEAKEAARTAEDPIEITMPEDKPRSMHRTPGFARMRTDWRGEDRAILTRAQAAVQGRISTTFAGAFEVMNQIYDIVRTPQVDAQGEIKVDQYGWTIWVTNEFGGHDEDFTRLTSAQKEDLLFKITTRIFGWEQDAADAWGEAMLAKAVFEERFALGFDAPMSGTVDDRKAAGALDARDERYFAILQSQYSRRAESLVRSMALLGQRIKDTMV